MANMDLHISKRITNTTTYFYNIAGFYDVENKNLKMHSFLLRLNVCTNAALVGGCTMFIFPLTNAYKQCVRILCIGPLLGRIISPDEIEID